METPLFLKIKSASGTDTPQFENSSENSISFHDSSYDFASVFHDVIPPDTLSLLTQHSATLILVGPTGSGKTTTLHEILKHFTESQTAKNSQINACEVNKNNSFVDLLDGSASKRYMSSVPFDNQLKKFPLDGRLVARLLRERSAAKTPANSLSSRSCLLVNIYHDSRLLTIVDMMGNEKFDSSACNSFANSNVSSLTHHLLAGSHAGRSHNLITNLIFRRASASNINFIMHLDQGGDADLIKSSLTNLVHAVKAFKSGQSQPPKFAKPASSSPSIAGLPNYARPTVSSASPKTVLSSYKVTKPVRNRVITPMNTPLSSKVSVSKMQPFNRPSPLTRKKSQSVSPNANSREVKQLHERVASLQTQLSNDKSMYVKTIEALQVQIRTVRNESVSVLQQGLSKTRVGFESVSKQLHKEKESNDSFRTQLSDLQSQNSKIDSQLADTVQLLDTRTCELTQARESSAEEKRSLVSAFESELNHMKETAASQKAHIVSLSDTKNQFELDLSCVSKERDELKLQLSDVAKELTEVTSKKDDQLSVLSGEKEGLRIENLQLSNRLASMESQLGEDTSRLSTENNSLKGELDLLNAELAKAKNQYDSVISELSNEKDLLKNENHQLNENLAKTKSEMEFQASTLSSKNDELKNENDQLTRKIADVTKNLESELNKVTQAKNRLSEQNKLLSTDLTTAQDKMQKEFSKLSSEKETLKTQNTQLGQKLVDAESQIQIEVSKLTSERDELRSVNSQLSDQLHETKAQMESRLAILSQERDVLKTNISDLTSKLYEAQNQVEITIATTSSEKDNLRKENSQLAENLLNVEKQMELETSKLSNHKEELKRENNILGEKLASTQNQMKSDLASVSSELNLLKKENIRTSEQLAQAIDDKKLLEVQISEAHGLAVSSEKVSRELQAELSQRKTQIQKIQEQLVAEQNMVAEKTSIVEKHNEQNETHLKKIQSLEIQLQTQARELLQKEQEMNQRFESAKVQHTEEVQRLERVVNETTSKNAELEESRKVRAEEVSALKVNLQQNVDALSEAQTYQAKCVELESAIQELSEKGKQREAEYESQITQLKEELGKVGEPVGSPKKIMDFAELDFNNGNNTFSSIDIFDDQTEYMNFFRRPAGRSPVASPTRVLTESTSRINTEVKSSNKPAPINLQFNATEASENEVNENV
ncbi:hypothetical protein JCM33374_g6249 [Metschnikowia sp. JCM 33374]|nr:hypothetical protein JCM33374_g6249 [Metschnikowia sp. JCM 33374]